MHLIIAGSRALGIGALIGGLMEYGLMEYPVRPSLIISGGAPGIDTAAELWAYVSNLPCEVYHANWPKHGRSAGVKRNIRMEPKGDALLAVWDGRSKGTEHMIKLMIEKKKPTYIYIPPRYRDGALTGQSTLWNGS